MRSDFPTASGEVATMRALHATRPKARLGCCACVLLWLAVALGTPAHAAGGCTLEKLTELPVTMAGLRALVPVTLNGSRWSMVLDSGAFYSMLTSETAVRLGLRLDPAPFGLVVGGVGGTAQVQVATVAQFAFANIPLKNVQFIVGGGTPGGGAAGVLGQNLLRITDVEYDLANGVIRLMQPIHCGRASLAYWAATLPVSAVDIEPTSAGSPWAVTTARLNGRSIRVMFDSGASMSLLMRHAAERAGITPHSPGVVPAGAMMGVGRGLVQTWRAPVDDLQIGNEEIRHTHMLVGDLSGDFDLLLGVDFFLSHRIYVANSQHRVYFTYNGGPVFSALSAPPSAAAAPAPMRAPAAPAAVPPSPPSPATATAAAAPPAAAPFAAEPADAAGFSRRGNAFAARRDYARALADLSRACELAPTEPAYFYQRGLVYLRLAQPDRAMADFGRALALAPDDVEARVARAALLLRGTSAAGPAQDAGAGEDASPGVDAGFLPAGAAVTAAQVAAALTDLDVADRDASAQADIRLMIAAAYARGGRLSAAIRQYDLWTVAHPDDARVASALNASCWDRALLGTQLDRALAACKGALRLTSQTAPILQSRGLVRLRLGQYTGSIADFSAALKRMPHSPWSLYGRGWDELRLGRIDAGRADIAAALALAPRIGERARAYGLAP